VEPLFPFEFIALMGWLSLLLVVGVMLRALVPLFQYFLFPASLIGGLVGLVLGYFDLWSWKPQDFESLAYHFFNLSFISLGLTTNTITGSKEQPADRLKAATWMMSIQGVAFCVLAFCGVVVAAMIGSSDNSQSSSFGFLLPLGFVEGPGQALSIAKVWETIGFEGATTVALSFASAGFLVALIVGVPLASNGLRRRTKNQAKGNPGSALHKGVHGRLTIGPSAGRLRFEAGNIDTLSFQIAVICAVYFATYLIANQFAALLPADIARALWGFLYILGLSLALLVRTVLARLKLDHLLDPGIQRRTTGVAVDFLIVATLCSIQLAVLADVAFIVVASVITGAIAATLAVVLLGKRLWSFKLERSMAIFGVVTGTLSTALLLLRLVDPDFRTGVASELAFMNLLAVPVIGLCLVLVNGPLIMGLSMPIALSGLAAVGLACLGCALAVSRPKLVEET